MKRTLVILLLSCLLLTACGTASDETTQSSSLDATGELDIAASGTDISSTESDLAPAQKPMVTVSVPATTREVAAQDGTVIFRQVSQSMSLIMPDPDVADRIIIDFLNRVDQAAATANSIQAQAETAYTGTEDWMPYLCSSIYSPTRIDQGVLSLYGSNVYYTGSAHAERSCSAANYDMVTGDVLTLGSILNSADSIEPLCELVLQKLDAVADEKYLWQGYQDTVRQRFAGEESYDEDWYFSTDGLCFYFAPYEIAPYSSGVIIAQIPYEELTGIIADAFFPPEQDTAHGTVAVQPAENADLTQFTRISEVILDKGAQMMLVHTDEAVQNIRIFSANSAAGDEYTVFAAQNLSAGDAIMVEAASETLAALTISYDSDGQTVTEKLITE